MPQNEKPLSYCTNIGPSFLALLFFNCCLIVVVGWGFFFPLRSSIHMKAPNVCIPEKWAPHGRACIGQIHFLASSSFCLKTDLKHLENLSIQLKCFSAFFPGNSGVTCDLCDGLFCCKLQPFPSSPAEPGKAQELRNGSNNNVFFVRKNPGGRARVDWSLIKKYPTFLHLFISSLYTLSLNRFF